MSANRLELLRSHLEEHQGVGERMLGLLPQVEVAAQVIWSKLSQGGRLFIMGNGGSAADAQHFAAELIGRGRHERPPLSALALTADTSTLTAIGNDYAFAQVFERQVRGFGARPGDIVLGLTTSGRSENVLRGLTAARQLGAATIALTGSAGLRIDEAADQVIAVPSAHVARVQEMHLLIIHMICDCIDEWAGE